MADPEGSYPRIENHNLLYVFLEIIVRTPMEKQLDLVGPIASRERFVPPSM